MFWSFKQFYTPIIPIKHTYLFLFQIQCNLNTKPQTGTIAVVNDTATQLTYHEFDLESEAYYVQIFLDPGSPIQKFTIYVSYNTTPDNFHYEYTAQVPIDPGQPTADPLSAVDPSLDVPPVLPVFQKPYTHILSRNFTNQTGHYVVGVYVEGDSSNIILCWEILIELIEICSKTFYIRVLQHFTSTIKRSWCLYVYKLFENTASITGTRMFCVINIFLKNMSMTLASRSLCVINVIWKTWACFGSGYYLMIEPWILTSMAGVRKVPCHMSETDTF